MFTRSVGLSALLTLTAPPALAEGKGDRAKKTIAEAQGALRQAREYFDAGHKESAIAAANQNRAEAQAV